MTRGEVLDLATLIWVIAPWTDGLYTFPAEPREQHFREGSYLISMSSGVNDEQLASLVIDLRADNRLCQIQEQQEPEEPRIICSLGLFDTVDSGEGLT